jgi:hypothetical protein
MFAIVNSLVIKFEPPLNLVDSTPDSALIVVHNRFLSRGQLRVTFQRLAIHSDSSAWPVAFHVQMGWPMVSASSEVLGSNPVFADYRFAWQRRLSRRSPILPGWR